jgi:hypothetical protein
MTSSECNALVALACAQDPQRSTKLVGMGAVECAVGEVQKFGTPSA